MKRSVVRLGLGIATIGYVAALAVSMQDLTAASQSAVASASIGRSSLMGTVRDADGKPLNGVAVSARSIDDTFTTAVYTDERGEYVFPTLKGGKYRVWAQAVKFVTERAEPALDASHTVTLDLTMKPLADYEMQLTGVEWYDALPDDTANHRRLKQVLYVACTGCHSLDVVLQNRFDEAGWVKIIRAMESSWYSGWRGVYELPTSRLRWEGQIMRYHRDELAKYLAEMRGPDPSPMQFKPLARPVGDAANVVITEYDLPISQRQNELPWYNGDDWMEGPSVGMRGIVGTHDVTVDAAGNAWVFHSATRGTFETNRNFIKLDPKTGDMTAFNLPNARSGDQVASITAKGEIWMGFTRLDTTTGTITAYTVPQVMGGALNSTDASLEGRVWKNGHFGALMFDPREQNDKGVAYPGWHLFQQLTPGDGTTYGIATDREENAWWSESYVDKVAKKDLKTGKVYEIDIRDPDYDTRKALATPADLAFYDSIGAETWATNSASPLPYANMPRRLDVDKRGDSVWVPSWAQSNITEIDIHTLKTTYHRLPINAHPYKTIVDKNHNVWTDVALADGTLKFNPSTKEWTLYRLPSHGCGSRHMGFDDFRNEAWLACDQASKVARFQFRSADDIRQLKAASSAAQK